MLFLVEKPSVEYSLRQSLHYRTRNNDSRINMLLWGQQKGGEKWQESVG
jgi:hypothetical protein